MDNQDLICTATRRIRSQWQQNPRDTGILPLSLASATSLVCSFRRLGWTSRGRGGGGGFGKSGCVGTFIGVTGWMAWDSLNLAFTNQRAAATTARRRAWERRRGGETEMREAVQFRSLSFRVFALRGSQPGKKKKSGGWRREPAARRRGETQALGRNSSEQSGRENKAEEQGARNGAWILRFLASHWFTSCLGIGRKDGGRREACARGASSRGGGRAISAVCMRGRRQTLLNCPMTPYIPFYWRTLLHPLTIPFRRSSRVVIPISKKTDPTPSLEGSLHEGNNTPRAFELRCLVRESLGKSILIGKRLSARVRES